MWSKHLGDFTIGSDDSTSSSGTSTTDNLVSLAANVVDMIHPYKQGVPVNVGIDAQTQSFLMMGGLLVAGLVILSLAKK